MIGNFTQDNYLGQEDEPLSAWVLMEVFLLLPQSFTKGVI